jgi:hypothetical protein
MSKKRVRGKGKRKTEAGNGKEKLTGIKLKYSFDQLAMGKSLTIEDADKPAGKVTVRENVRVLAYEFGLRHGMKFKVSPIEEGKCTVTRIK